MNGVVFHLAGAEGAEYAVVVVVVAVAAVVVVVVVVHWDEVVAVQEEEEEAYGASCTRCSSSSCMYLGSASSMVTRK